MAVIFRQENAGNVVSRSVNLISVQVKFFALLEKFSVTFASQLHQKKSSGYVAQHGDRRNIRAVKVFTVVNVLSLLGYCKTCSVVKNITSWLLGQK